MQIDAGARAFRLLSENKFTEQGDIDVSVQVRFALRQGRPRRFPLARAFGIPAPTSS